MTTTTSNRSAQVADHSSGLSAIFAPKSVAIVGASSDPQRIGGRIVKYLKDHFRGSIYPVNPRHGIIQTLPAFRSVSAIPATVDLALINIPAEATIAALQECSDKGVKAAIVFSSGFAEAGVDGERLQTHIREIANGAGMRVLGPNCLGAMDFHSGAIATFSIALDITPIRAGNVAVVSQSGAFAAHVFTLASQRGVGFSKWVTTGNEGDIDAAEVIAFVADDPATDVIMVYLEGCRDGSRLRWALDKARCARKPVVVIKVGRSESGARAALTHTAAIAGADEAYDALFRAVGACRAYTIDQFLDFADAASSKRLPKGRKIGLVSMSGGVGILMADQCREAGLELNSLPEQTRAKLASFLPHSSVANPIDVTAQLINEPDVFARTIDALLESDACDSIAIFLTTVTYAQELRKALLKVFSDVRKRHAESVIGVCMMAPEDVRRELRRLNYIQIAEPSRLVNTMAALAGMREGFERRANLAHDEPAGKSLAICGGPVGEHEAKVALSQAGIPFAVEARARSADEAVAAAERIGYPVVLKLASADIPHKSEIGGVILDLQDADAVRVAFATIVERAETFAPEACIDGVLVAEMIASGFELIVGARIDDTAGPLITVGAGGVFVEILKDSATACAPLTDDESLELIRRLKVSEILEGVRGRKRADIESAARVVAKLSHLIVASADLVRSIEINPLIVRNAGAGAIGVDALVVIAGRQD